MDAASMMTAEELKKELKALKDKVINFSPPPITRQTRYYKKQKPLKGNFIGNNLNGLGNHWRP